MKASTGLTIMLIVFLSSCPAMAIYAQSYFGKPEPTVLQRIQLIDFTEITLQDNPFRWNNDYLQALRNQKEMDVSHLPHINIHLNKIADASPKIYFKCKIDNESTSFADLLLNLGYFAMEYCYNRYSWSNTFLPISTEGGRKCFGTNSQPCSPQIGY